MLQQWPSEEAEIDEWPSKTGPTLPSVRIAVLVVHSAAYRSRHKGSEGIRISQNGQAASIPERVQGIEASFRCSKCSLTTVQNSHKALDLLNHEVGCESRLDVRDHEVRAEAGAIVMSGYFH